MKNSFGIYFLFFILSLLLLTSCKPKELETEQDPIIYFASGVNWDVTVELDNEDEQFLMEFTYKGDIEDFRELERLQFFTGTRLKTYSHTFLDNSLNEGDSPLDIYFIDFQNNDSKTFNISFSDTTNLNTIKDLNNSMKMDGLLINVTWGNGRLDYSNQLNISGFKSSS